MKCPNCEAKLIVTKSFDEGNGYIKIRSRMCQNCSLVFETREQIILRAPTSGHAIGIVKVLEDQIARASKKRNELLAKFQQSLTAKSEIEERFRAIEERLDAFVIDKGKDGEG